MALFKNLFKKKEEVTFTKVKEEEFTLSNQNGRIVNPTKTNLKDYLNDLLEDPDQFLTLSLAQAKNGIRYVQACFVGTSLLVQLGLEQNNQTRLVEKICSNSQECIAIFYQFYDFGTVDHIENYKPVQF